MKNNFYALINSLNLGKAYSYAMNNNSGNVNPYHNNFHLESVCEMAIQGYNYHKYDETGLDFLSNNRGLELIAVAALFHDFGHTGSGKNDDLNIDIAKSGLAMFLSEGTYIVTDKEEELLYSLIDATRFPYKSNGDDLNLLQKILRDSDILQAMYSSNFINGIVRALATEMNTPEVNITFETVLDSQESFYKNMTFCTEWGNSIKEERLPQLLTKVNIVKSFM